jgi:hypothetical protein
LIRVTVKAKPFSHKNVGLESFYVDFSVYFNNKFETPIIVNTKQNEKKTPWYPWILQSANIHFTYEGFGFYVLTRWLFNPKCFPHNCIFSIRFPLESTWLTTSYELEYLYRFYWKKLAKVTGPNQFSLATGHRTTAKVDDSYYQMFSWYYSSTYQLNIW